MAHTPRYTRFTVIGLALLTGLIAGACSGAEFTEAQNVGGSGGGGQDAGTAGRGGGASLPCSGPEECDDQDPCTVDECLVEGFCRQTPLCEDGELCCDGTCSECCAHEDCSDGVECTEDQCFSGFCAHVPDDGACATAEYCAMASGCKEREPCPSGTDAECEDDDACTDDACVDGFCTHEYCSGTEQCCPGLGCAECCSDSQCADGEPCTQNACVGGECSEVPLCGGELSCCPSVDRASALCGSCCSAEDCADEIECTDDKCTLEGCQHVPNSTRCGDEMVCDPVRGCVAPTGCKEHTDCGQGLRCCNGTCQQCCVPEDCLVATTQFAPVGCQLSTCTKGQCQTTYEECGDFETCCAPYGCGPFECPVPY